MSRRTIEELRRTPEWRAAVQRDVDAAVAAGLPRYVEDAVTLDSIAAVVAASRRSREPGRPGPAARARGPGETTTPRGSRPAASRRAGAEGQGDGTPPT